MVRLPRRLENELGCKDYRVATHTTQASVTGEKERNLAMVMIHDKVWFHSAGTSARYAKKRAAEAALEALDGLPEFEFRKRYRCDCVDSEDKADKEDETGGSW